MAHPHADDLQALAEELQEIAAAPPEAAMMTLAQLTDYQSGDRHVVARLRRARQVAAVAAVAKAGSQAKLARLLGVSEMLVSKIVRGTRRHP